NRRRLNQPASADDALRPRRQSAGRIKAFDVAPIGLDEIGVPLVEARDTSLAHQLHPETCRLELVAVQYLEKPRPVFSLLQLPELVRQRRRDPLDGMSKQMQEQKALHLEPDVRIDSDAQAVENAGPRRFEVAVLDHKPVFDDAGRDSSPQVNHVSARQFADDARADKL